MYGRERGEDARRRAGARAVGRSRRQGGGRTRRRTRAAGLRLAVAAVAGLVVFAGVQAPAGALSPPAASTGGSAVGTWKGTVKHGEGSDELTLSFHADGAMCLALTGGGGAGKGTWRSTGAETFTYEARERLVDGAGTVTGYVDISQQAVRSSAEFHSSGQSKVYDADGEYVGTGEAEVSARQVSGTPQSC